MTTYFVKMPLPPPKMAKKGNEATLEILTACPGFLHYYLPPAFFVNFSSYTFVFFSFTLDEYAY